MKEVLKRTKVNFCCLLLPKILLALDTRRVKKISPDQIIMPMRHPDVAFGFIANQLTNNMVFGFYAWHI